MFPCFLTCSVALIFSCEQTGVGELASLSPGAWKPQVGASGIPRSALSLCSLQGAGCDDVVSKDGALAAPGALRLKHGVPVVRVLAWLPCPSSPY